jgi:CRISPR/Cas system-associated exonuclease Cas4 (RecB family)
MATQVLTERTRMATRRTGKPYIWVTYLSKLLGGNQCLWSAWFKAHYRYQKYEVEAADLAEWNRDHSRLMRQRREEMEEAGWTVAVEDQNEFKLEGTSAVVAGKPDLIATLPGHVLVIDGKTGRERDSDYWQVLLYLFALPKSRPDLVGKLEGEVQYQRGDKRVTVKPSDLSPARLDDVVSLIKVIGSDEAPSRAPSREECKRCNIGFADCPERFKERAQAAVMASEF